MATNHLEKSISLTEQISSKADEALSDLELEMSLRKWPAEFRAIMWDAVAVMASLRAKECRGQ